MTRLDDWIAISAFVMAGMALLIMAASVGMVVLGFTPFAWALPVIVTLVAGFTALVIVSELV